MEAIQPVDTSHISVEQVHTLLHRSPYVGYGHLSVQLGPMWPGVHSENKEWSLKLTHVAHLYHQAIYTSITIDNDND